MPPRGPDGLTQCEVTMTLPLPGTADEAAPSSCSDLASLRELSPPQRARDGRAICELRQLAVTGSPHAPQLEPGEGWFFDDFSDEDVCRCGTGACASVFFAPSMPPSGVHARIECFATTVLDVEPGDRARDPSLCRVP
jgi:hypothetical protein